jgi:hypothetical protein
VRNAVCLVTMVGTLLAVRPAGAIPYEAFIDAADEEDLQDLFAAGTIDQDTFDDLIDLMTAGVDLSTANRAELYALPNLTYDDVDAILAYRELVQGRLRDPAELVAGGALTPEKLLAISAFLIVSERRDGKPLGAQGFVRVMTRSSPHDFNPYAPQDPFLPPLSLRGRVTAARHLTAGFALTTTRNRIGEPVFDPNRGVMVADAPRYDVVLPKAYIKYENDKVSAVLGTYRAGFGQRLVFDNSARYTPNGLYLDDQLFYRADLTRACKQSAGELPSPCTGLAGAEYVTPDFAFRQGLMGVAAGAKHIELPTGFLQAYAFGSVSRRSIYQYELVDRNACPDPYDDADPACSAPQVFVRPEGDLLTPTTRHSFQVLPNVFQEQLAGGNVAYFADRRNSVGLTAYGARMVNLVDGIDLDFQEWSRYPIGGRYGAVGSNFSYGRGWLDIFGEAALSFDSMRDLDPTLTRARGGGGPAAIVRATATRKREELEVVARYYSVDYANPYGRPISQPDQFDGQRARDEAGARVRYVRTDKDLTIRALVDVWVNPSTGIPKLDTFARVNVKTTDHLWLGLWERYQDKDLTRGGHDQCFEVSNEFDETGEPVPCGGRQLTTMLRANFIPNKKLQGTLILQHQLLDDNTRMELRSKFRQDLSAWLIAHYRPTPGIRMRGRVRYLYEAVHDDAYLERSVATVLDSVFRLRGRDSARVRFDTKFWLDSRMNTSNRVPNPELVLWLFYEARL